MIQEANGNLLDAEADALVNTVNTVGVMGKGIALQFKRAYPENFRAYKRACDAGEVETGRMLVWDAGALVPNGARYVINFPTKRHWKSRSRIADIRSGLDDLIRQVRDLGIKRIAVPPLGCGNGGLRWAEVRPLIEAAFQQVPDVEVLLFSPEGAPPAAQQPIRTERPRMTPGKAALIGIMRRYLPFTIEITAVDIQKAMYFMQVAGEPLNLRYAKGRYGPYADNLRHVLTAMEGHHIRGVGDGSAKALDAIPFELIEGAHDEAAALLEATSATAERIDRVMTLVEGFESTYGLELLATVHWAATRDDEGLERPAIIDERDVQQAVRSWNLRKARLFTERDVSLAYERLEQLGWLTAPQGDLLLKT